LIISKNKPKTINTKLETRFTPHQCTNNGKIAGGKTPESLNFSRSTFIKEDDKHGIPLSRKYWP